MWFIQNVQSLYIILGCVCCWNLDGFPPNFQHPPEAKLRIELPKGLFVQEVLEVLYYHAKFGGTQISPATKAAKNIKYFVCHALNVRNGAYNFAMNELEYRNNSDTVG